MRKTELHKRGCLQISIHLKYANLWTLNTWNSVWVADAATFHGSWEYLPAFI